MIRLFGALLLVTGSSVIGVMAVFQLRDREKDLSGLIRGLEGMKRGLLSRTEGLKEMLCDAENQTEGRAGAFFRSLHQGIDRLDDGSFSQLWKDTLKEDPLRCGQSELAELEPLGEILGRYDFDSQSEALDRAIAALKFSLTEAVERRKSLGRVYGTMGVSIGVLLAIMLI